MNDGGEETNDDGKGRACYHAALFDTSPMHHASTRHIRAMQGADLAAILAVQAACYPPSMQEAEAVVRARIEAAAGSCMVALDDAGVCGYLFAYPSVPGVLTRLGAPFELAPGAQTLYLHDLAVAPRAHGRGLARRLVGHLLALARTQGFTSSALVSVQDTMGFWTALGYRAFDLRCDEARAALASYPGAARYMTQQLTGPGAPSPSC